MENLSLTPATQAVLDALTDLGQGNVHELADRSGKARSTTDKAIKTLADAGVIVAVDTDADSAEGTPTRWTLATPATDAVPDDVAGPGDGHTAGADETEQPADPDPVDAAPATGDTEPADHPDNDADGDAHQEPDAAANESDRIDASDKACDDADNSDEGREAPTVTVVQPTRPGDRKVMAIKGVLADYGDDGATLDVIVAESGIGHVTAARLLTVMEQADAARRRPDLPDRWIPGPTKASEVDPNPEPPLLPALPSRHPRRSEHAERHGHDTAADPVGRHPARRRPRRRDPRRHPAHPSGPPDVGQRGQRGPAQRRDRQRRRQPTVRPGRAGEAHP